MSIGMIILSCFVYLLGGALLFAMGALIIMMIMCLIRNHIEDMGESHTDIHYGEVR